MDRTRRDYGQSLSADCDLHLQASEIVLARDISSCHNGHLCNIILKSNLAGQIRGSEMKSFPEDYAQSFSADCDLEL